MTQRIRAGTLESQRSQIWILLVIYCVVLENLISLNLNFFLHKARYVPVLSNRKLLVNILWSYIPKGEIKNLLIYCTYFNISQSILLNIIDLKQDYFNM